MDEDMSRFTLFFLDKQIEDKFTKFGQVRKDEHMRLGTWAFFAFLVIIQAVYFFTGFHVEAGLPTSIPTLWFLLFIGVASVFQLEVVREVKALALLTRSMSKLYFFFGLSTVGYFM